MFCVIYKLPYPFVCFFLSSLCYIQVCVGHTYLRDMFVTTEVIRSNTLVSSDTPPISPSVFLEFDLLP